MVTMSDDRPPVDLEEALERTGGEMDFLQELLGLFLEDVPPRLEALKAALGAGNAPEAAAVAHAIKGAAANLSALPIRELAYQLETMGRAGSLVGAEDLTTRLEHEVGRLAAFAATL